VVSARHGVVKPFSPDKMAAVSSQRQTAYIGLANELEAMDVVYNGTRRVSDEESDGGVPGIEHWF